MTKLKVVTDVLFADEPFNRLIYDEMMPLMKLHWREIAHYQDIPLNPDFEKYEFLAARGGLRVFTARTRETNEMVGYAVFFVAPNIHYKDSLQALQDVLFIHPEKRGFGKFFIPWCDDRLRESGVQVVSHHVKVAHDFGSLLESIGYEWVERFYQRRLDHGV